MSTWQLKGGSDVEVLPPPPLPDAPSYNTFLKHELPSYTLVSKRNRTETKQESP